MARRAPAVPEDEQPRYEALKQAVEDLMSSDEYGAPVGACVGWVLVAVEQDITNQREACTIVPAPWQSYTMTRGLLALATDDAYGSYVANGLNAVGEDEDD